MANEPSSGERATLQRKLDELLQQQHDLSNRLQQGHDRFKRLARSVWSVQEQERRKLARELHDGIGQNLTAIMNLIGIALQRPDSQHAELEKARALAEMTLQETRALSRFLRPTVLDDLGLEAALRWLTRTMAEANGWQINLDLPATMPVLDGELATLVFRTAQETLTNAAKHARAHRVDVTLRQQGAQLRLTVRDDGRGCDISKALAGGRDQGSGLGGLRDRVHVFDGELRVESVPDSGFQISIDVPLPSEVTRK